MAENSLNEIKKLMKIIGGKVIIVEDGKPTMVIINIDEYIRFEKKDSPKETGDLSDKNLVERINKNINIWKNRQEERKLKQLEGNGYRETKKTKENFKESNNNNEDDKNNENSNEIVIEKL